MLDAMSKPEPIVLEPIVTMQSTVPHGTIGAVTGELSTRRARITGQDRGGDGEALVSALVPLSEVGDYASRLKSLTGGEGSYTMELAHYDPVPARRQQDLVAAFKPTN